MLDSEEEKKKQPGGVFAALLWLLCVHVDLNVNIDFNDLFFVHTV